MTHAPTRGFIDRWLLMRQTIKHLEHLEREPLAPTALAERIRELLERVQAARDAGADRHVPCPKPVGGDFVCRCRPRCGEPLRALAADLGELEALNIAYGAHP